jgi:hypothetical protein
MCYVATARGHSYSAYNMYSQAQIRALEDDVGQENNTTATKSSKGKGKADGEGQASKKARNGGT